MSGRHVARVVSLAIAITVTCLGAAGVASAVPRNFGGDCTIYPDNRAATIDSLRFRCSPEQQDAVFLAASAGAVPIGWKNGWVARPPIMVAASQGIWMGKTFATGPDGGSLMNRLTGAQVEAWRADVYRAPAILDGKPCWVLNYAPSPSPPLYDEVREVVPGVWFGYSWWRGGLQTTLLLTFILG